MAGSVLGAGDIAVNRTDKYPCFHGAAILEGGRQAINKKNR